MGKAELILKEKEIQGVVISLIGKIVIVASLGFFTIFIAKTNFELFAIFFASLLVMFIFYLCIRFIRKNRFVTAIGTFSILIDVLFVTALPFIWYNSVGGDLVPRTYLLKTYTQYLIAGTLAINAFTLKPSYPIMYSLGVVSGQAMILFYAQKDPRFKNTDSFLEAILGNSVHTGNYIMNMFIISLMGFAFAFLTLRIRKTVLLAAKNEVKANQLSRYFSPNVVDEISSQKEGIESLGGRLQKVTVLFCDIIGFTKVAESLGPEKTFQLLSEYHEKMIQIVFNYRGTLDKYIGDGMLITFGTPNSMEDDCHRALLCAIEMQKYLSKWNQERQVQSLPPVLHRVGIHYGDVLVGNIGAESRLEYTVIGDTVNVASRIESLGKELSKSFIVSEEFTKQIPDIKSIPIQLQDLGNHMLRGKSQGIKLFSVEVL